MGEPTPIGEEIQQRQDVATREEIEALHEQIGNRINDSERLAQVMETSEELMDRGFLLASRAHAVMMLHQPHLIRGNLSSCRCSYGWVFEGDRDARPCGRCNPGAYERWSTSAGGDLVLGPRNHLHHDPYGCDVCEQAVRE